jgi:tRNA (cmo5U34)-methyltransferase
MQAEVTDNIQPGSRWVFDDEVANCFDNMLARSIPQYQVMREAAFELGKQFVQSGTSIVDLGCSRGEALAPYIREFGVNNRYIGVEVSGPMAQAARDRFDVHIRNGIVDIREIDLNVDYPKAKSSLTLSILTAQFIPIEYRQRVIRSVYCNTVEGGVFLIVEKVLGSTAGIDEQMVARYYDMKKKNGYSLADIDRKRHSLEGVLVPVTAHWNEELLRSAGFSEVDCFWRWMNFAGWIAIKGGSR